MQVRYAIIGGGVAGLCAAIRLAELNEEPLVIEGGTYPTHKVCGEFLSPECITQLNKWNIYPTKITKFVLNNCNQSFNFDFPESAGGLSHIQLDPALAAYAKLKGAIIKTSTRVNAFIPKKRTEECHKIELSSGEIIAAEHVIFATGRLPSYHTQIPEIKYMGFKAHFKNIQSTGHLEMFSFKGAYLGIAPIENQIYNVACLAQMTEVNACGGPDAFLKYIIASHPYLKNNLNARNNLFANWMQAKIPDFTIRKTPKWLDAYFIGDAAMAIPPACGDGLALAILGGCLVAEYAHRKEFKIFKKLWNKRCGSQMFWTKRLHYIMLNPSYNQFLFSIIQKFPFLSRKIYNKTRHTF